MIKGKLVFAHYQFQDVEFSVFQRTAHEFLFREFVLLSSEEYDSVLNCKGR